MTMLQRMSALALLVLVVVGCSPAALKVANAPQNACDDALGSGRLVANAQSGLGLSSAGQAIPVLWPFGYSARRETTGLVLLDPNGNVVAREGDFVQAGGGTGNDGFFVVCSGSVKVVPAPA